MKTKKVVVGAIAATMLSLSVCPIAPAVAANDTVQISVSKVEAKAGEKVTVDVSFADIPSTKIQSTDFAIAFDSTYFTIDEVKAGSSANTGANSGDVTADIAIFESSVADGEVKLVWTTGLEDSSYWIGKDGVFCTISGTVSADAPEGTVIDFSVVPRSGETYPGSGVENNIIRCGYFDGTEGVSYKVNTVDGYVKVMDETPKPSDKRGDANCDGIIDISDAVLIMQSLANPDVYGVKGSDPTHITDQGLKNADVSGGDADKGGDGVTNADALRIQEYRCKLVDTL